jgi:hypothetical protein
MATQTSEVADSRGRIGFQFQRSATEHYRLGGALVLVVACFKKVEWVVSASTVSFASLAKL